MQPKTKRLEHPKKPTSTPQTPNPLFPVGSEVEVTSDEEGFRGAWYLATVINPPHSLSSKQQQQQQQQQQVFVEYKNLVSEENGSTLLTEYVDLAFLRPKPPVEDDGVVSFEVNDVVDAFFQDGWWIGVITEVISENSRYKVFFSNPPDEMEFGLSDLRVHRNWVDGKWVLPQKQRMRELNFSPGTAVEVNIDPDNSPDVWFPATFIKQVANNLLLVEYRSTREAALQKLTVDSLHIRPSPPSSNNRVFNLLEKVEAFYDCRWLTGVVTKILADGRYIVYFKHTKKEKELLHADLRPQMEWSNGKWVHYRQATASNSKKQSDNAINGSYKGATGAPPEGSGTVKENVGEERISSVTLRSFQKELQTPSCKKANQNSTTPLNKKTKKTNAGGDAINSRPSKRLNEEASSDAPLSPEAGKSKTKQMEGSSNGTLADVDNPSPEGESGLKQSEGSNQPSTPTEVKEDHEVHPVTRKRGRPPKHRESSLPVNEPEDEPVTKQNQTPKRSGPVEPYLPVVIGLTYDGKMIDSRRASSNQRPKEEPKKVAEDEEKQVETSADHGSIGSEQPKDNEITNLKRKRGRPPKVLFRVGSPKTKEAELAEKGEDVSHSEDTPERHFPVDEAEKPVATEPAGISDSRPSPDTRIKRVRIISDQIKHMSSIRRLNRRSTRRPVRKLIKQAAIAEIDESVKPLMIRRQGIRKQQLSEQPDEPPTEEAVAKLGEGEAEVLNNGRQVTDADTVAETSSYASDDDRPLSAWFEGAHSPPKNDGRVSVAGTAGQSDETGERRDNSRKLPTDQPKEKAAEKKDENTPAENITQDNDVQISKQDERAKESSTAIVATRDDRDLPFVKNSLIWQMIESMDILKRIPQKPHFRPLYDCKEECREGLAIGSMVTFTSLVERISKLRFDDPKSLLNGYLEALVDLEVLGFNVGPMQEQLNSLLSIKGRHEQAQNTTREIECQITERAHERSKINEEIQEIDKKIAELMEKRALALSEKERKDTEISLLKSSVGAVNGTLESAREEFERVASSLW